MGKLVGKSVVTYVDGELKFQEQFFLPAGLNVPLIYVVTTESLSGRGYQVDNIINAPQELKSYLIGQLKDVKCDANIIHHVELWTVNEVKLPW